MTVFPDPLVFRTARNEDGGGMAVLIERIFQDYENCPFFIEEFPELQHPADHYGAKSGQLWVLEQVDSSGQKVICGSIATMRNHQEGVFEVFKFYLAHAFRGQNIARLMIEQVFDYAAKLGATSLVLWTDTRFKAAHRFYEKMGFVKLPGVRALHDSGDTLEFGYWRDLGQSGSF